MTFLTNKYTDIPEWLVAFYGQQTVKNSFLKLKDFQNLLDSVLSLNKLQIDMGYNFKNSSILLKAITHSSFSFEFSVPSNENLEFLGDSLVNLMVSNLLYKNYPDLNEGELSKLRSSLVNENALSLLAETIFLESNILLGKGELKNKGNYKKSILCDTFEALMGSIYIDCNEDLKILEKVFQNILNKFEKINSINFLNSNNTIQIDYKTKLQEEVMAKYKSLPVYKSQEINFEFLVELWIENKLVLTKCGPSKKNCEKELAKIALIEKKY